MAQDLVGTSSNTPQTLWSAVNAHLNFHESHRDIVVMVCKQMHKRWLKFCEEHASVVVHMTESGREGQSPRLVPALPQVLVSRFVSDNIVWAKAKVTVRLNNVMWARFTPYASTAPNSPDTKLDSDDEYDPSVEF